MKSFKNYSKVGHPVLKARRLLSNSRIEPEAYTVLVGVRVSVSEREASRREESV
ncbi:hypothetical protein IQ229_14575 [Nostoc cf. edaphicum LEGE 07299]|uniref:Transposase n=1 Tax=Nostoc cf. edaphicum LEGE 07299 TaxID=2777974 RepID=A0ABR9U0D4_9NOSO|nr:hypothetical protein [Nostoc edaphicum]MBE9106121.1 hypothetical protein [Nostoc cf. edaphicum LEGE 07299]